MTDIQLEPCKHCGGPAKMHHYQQLAEPGNRFSWVECTSCGIKTAMYHTPGIYDSVDENAASIWNRKPKEEA